MKKILSFFCLAILSLTVSTTQSPAALINFSFNGSAGDEISLAPDAQPAHLTVSSMTRGSGITASSASGTFSAKSWTTGSTADLNDYFSFSITPQTGHELSLTSLILDEQRSGTGIRSWAVRSSLDSFVSDLATFSVPDNNSLRFDQTTTLDGAFNGITSEIEFRIYGYEAEGNAGTWRLDNVRVNGLLTSPAARVPESLPASFSSLALCGVIFYSRKFFLRTQNP